MDGLQERVEAVFREALERTPVDLAETFRAMGLDSLEVMDLHFRLEEEFDCPIPEARMLDFRSGLDVVAFLRAECPEKALAP